MRECAGHGCTNQVDGQVYCRKCLSKMWVDAHVWYGEDRGTDTERATDLVRFMYDMYSRLDEQKERIAIELPLWMHTKHASALIQAMAHIDNAIRILEKDLG